MNDRKIQIDDFSGGMWRLKANLEPFSGDKVEMSAEDIMPFLAASGTESPLLIRVNRTFLVCHASNSLPYKTVAIPEDVEDELDIDIPSEKYIYVVKQQDELKKVLLNGEDI